MMASVPHVSSGSGLKKISGRWIFVGQSVQEGVLTWFKGQAADFCDSGTEAGSKT